MIDGTPARLLMFVWRIWLSRLSRAYSDRYIAAPIPIGSVNSATRMMIWIEPTMAGRIPAFSGRRDGTPVRKSTFSQGRPVVRMSSSNRTSARSRTRIAVRQAP